jgi:hypothetical protein
VTLSPLMVVLLLVTEFRSWAITSTRRKPTREAELGEDVFLPDKAKGCGDSSAAFALLIV